MADQFNDSVPAATNSILADIADIAETLGWIKDCFQHVCNGFSNTSLTSLGFVHEMFINPWLMKSTTTAGATFNEGSEYATNDVMKTFFQFSNSSEEYVCFDAIAPPGWDRGTIKAKFYWSTNLTGSSTGETVEWEIAGLAIGNDDAIDAAYGTAQVISDALTADNGGDLQITATTPALTIGGTPALGDLLQFKVSRNVGGTDDCPVGARLFGVLLQFNCTFPDASGTNAVAAW